jgi:hypothetical protein
MNTTVECVAVSRLLALKAHFSWNLTIGKIPIWSSIQQVGSYLYNEYV